MTIRQLKRLIEDMPDETEVLAIDVEFWTPYEVQGVALSNTGTVTIRLVEASASVPFGGRL